VNKYDKGLLKYSTKEVADEAEKAICDYAKMYSKQNIIGGPIMILMIKPDNSVEWLKNEKKSRGMYDTKDFRWLYESNKLNIHFLSDDKKLRFEQIIKTL
jgi:predicted nucleic acid-binding protein